MKLPSIVKLPRNRQFAITPRYYDPVKEEVKERTARIQRELDKDQMVDYKSTISSAFSRRSRHQNKGNNMQFLFILLLAGSFAGYIFYGALALYAALALIPLYVLLKLKRSH
ncbi:MAG: hypothetical protein ACOCXH_06170 [Cyclobacteriaceae bacterium]